MKRTVSMIVEKNKLGDITCTFPEIGREFMVSREMQLYGNDIPRKPRVFVRKGKLTPAAKVWINYKPYEERLFDTIISIILQSRS